MNDTIIHGYELDEIDEVAQEIYQCIVEQQVDQRLALIALCRTIVMTGSQEDLDMACRIIDDIAEVMAEDAAEVDVEEEDGDQM